MKAAIFIIYEIFEARENWALADLLQQQLKRRQAWNEKMLSELTVAITDCYLLQYV